PIARTGEEPGARLREQPGRARADPRGARGPRVHRGPGFPDVRVSGDRAKCIAGKLEPAGEGGSLRRAMRSAETEHHSRLKTLALAWAQANGFAICAPEVRVPRSGFRADVAACSRGAGARTAVFECKQSRADLLKDAH